jgi:glycosyltransferase involved in cell wall biosynthesis
MIKVAITIPAFKAAPFIEETLESIHGQALDTGIEIIPLIGVDGCKDTAEYLRGGFFWSPENVGPYVIRNSLMEKVPNVDYYLSFCADDVLLEHGLMTMLDYAKQGYDLVKPKGQNMDSLLILPHGEPYHMGVMLFSREVLEALGGYRQARIYSDTDLWNRAKDAGFSRIKISETCFLRRLHGAQITKSEVGLNTMYHKKERARANKLRKAGDLKITPKVVQLEAR